MEISNSLINSAGVLNSEAASIDQNCQKFAWHCSNNYESCSRCLSLIWEGTEPLLLKYCWTWHMLCGQMGIINHEINEKKKMGFSRERERYYCEGTSISQTKASCQQKRKHAYWRERMNPIWVTSLNIFKHICVLFSFRLICGWGLAINLLATKDSIWQKE